MLELRLNKKNRLRERQWRDASSSRCIGMAAAAMPSTRAKQSTHPPDTFAGRLVGTWSFVSSVNTRKDGSTFDRWGANPRGHLHV